MAEVSVVAGDQGVPAAEGCSNLKDHGQRSQRAPAEFAGSKLAHNLLELFDRAVERGGDEPFLWQKQKGEYSSTSWKTVGGQVATLANALVRAGLEPGDRVVLSANNRPEWCIADLAIMRAGGISVPAYATNLPDDHRYVLEHCDARMAIAGSRQVINRMAVAARGYERLRHVVLMDDPGDTAFECDASRWADALDLGAGSKEVEYTRELSADDVACFIYTSGTGGRPKAVMLTHRNILANVWGAHQLLEKIGLGKEIFLSFLPLSHSYEHTVGQFFPIAVNAEIYYSGGVEHLAKNLTEVRPTIVACVPRLYEVLRQKMLAGLPRQGKFKEKLFHKAVELGSRKYESGRLSVIDSIQDWPLEGLVREKVRERFGGRLKALISGGAPLNYEVGLFFTALGLPVLQGYGQTESSPVVSVNPPNKVKLNTVGPPLDQVEIAIADDGEILVRGDLVMRGYWKDQEATESTVKDGWLHTGDIGEIDDDGYLRITDRKKDMIVNSGGDNIAPQKVEGCLALQPEIEQAAVFGDRESYLVAVIVPRQELMVEVGGGGAQLEAIHDDPKLHARIQDGVDRANGSLSVIERVRKFIVAKEAFTSDNGMMTPTMKLKRHVIRNHYKDDIARLYR